jgi:integrase
MPCVQASCLLFAGSASTRRNRKCTYSRPPSKAPFGWGKTKKSLGRVHLPKELADDLWLWKQECPDSSPEAFIFPDAEGGFMDTGNYRLRVLHKLAKDLELPKLTFQVIRRTIATLAQKKGTVKDVQGLLRHSRAATTTDVYMQEIPESVQATVNAINAELRVQPKDI